MGKLGIINMFLILATFVSSSYSSKTYTAVSSYFAQCDKFLEELTIASNEITKLNDIDKLFNEKITQMPSFEYIMRINSKGKIISKVTGNGREKRTFRYVGSQKWFKVLVMTSSPYYGTIINNGVRYLFWNKPLMVRKRGKTRFGGAIAAKISFEKSFSEIAQNNSLTFEVRRNDKLIYSNLEKGEVTTEKISLAINGLETMMLYFTGDTIISDTILQKDSSNVGVANVQNKEVAKEVILKPNEISVSALAFLVFIFLGIIGAILIMVKRSEENRRKLLDAIYR